MYRAVLESARRLIDFEKTLLDKAMLLAAPLAFGALVDVGCGDKPYEALFTPYVSKYVGVEYDETFGTSAYAAAGRRADVVYSGERLPFEDGSFDTVLSNQVGEHVPDPRVFFAELVRILRPGGRLIFTVPFSFRIHAEPNDFHRFTKYALERYARDAGLSVDLLAARGGFWSVIGHKLTSHMALHLAHLDGDIQSIGGFGYERIIRRRPRYWTLPVLGPAIVGVAIATRILDRVDPDESDTIGYVLVATKR